VDNSNNTFIRFCVGDGFIGESLKGIGHQLIGLDKISLFYEPDCLNLIPLGLSATFQHPVDNLFLLLFFIGLVLQCICGYLICLKKQSELKELMEKHETKYCPECQTRFECKVGSILLCQCTSVALTEPERNYLHEKYDDCLCANCMQELKTEFHNNQFKQ